jgi:hypothetical protein
MTATATPITATTALTTPTICSGLIPPFDAPAGSEGAAPQVGCASGPGFEVGLTGDTRIVVVGTGSEAEAELLGSGVEGAGTGM